MNILIKVISFLWIKLNSSIQSKGAAGGWICPKNVDFIPNEIEFCVSLKFSTKAVLNEKLLLSIKATSSLSIQIIGV